MVDVMEKFLVKTYLCLLTHSSFVPQGHLREGKCHLLLGNARAASRCFQKVIELESDNSQAQQEVRHAVTVDSSQAICFSCVLNVRL